MDSLRSKQEQVSNERHSVLSDYSSKISLKHVFDGTYVDRVDDRVHRSAIRVIGVFRDPADQPEVIGFRIFSRAQDGSRVLRIFFEKSPSAILFLGTTYLTPQKYKKR